MVVETADVTVDVQIDHEALVANSEATDEAMVRTIQVSTSLG